MALKLAVRHKGFLPNYFNILTVNLNKENLTTEVKLGLYIDEQARRESVHNHLTTLDLTFNEFGLTLEQIYNKIKQLPEFSEAENC